MVIDLDLLKSLLRRRGYSQTGLANTLRRSPASISRMLKGERQIKASEVSLIERYLGQSIRPSESDDAILLAALKQAAHDFADIQFSAPAPFADMALKGEKAVRAAIAKARKP